MVPSHRNLRLLAKIDYVTDPEDRPARWHYERGDRDYGSVSFATFERWSTEDGWVEARSHYYHEIEQRIIAERLDHLLQQRFKEIDGLEEDLKYLHEWVTPLRDQYGHVKRYPLTQQVGDPRKGTMRIEPHPFAGLPMYALPFKSMEKVVDAFLKMDERLMLKRGDATSRTESHATSTEGGAGRPSVLDPKMMLTQVSKEERAAMAHALLLHRQPELQQHAALKLSDLAEKDIGDDDGDTI